MAQVERTQIDNTSSILKVSITKADYLPEFQSQLKSYRNRVQMKGFRPGTVPMPMVKKLYGKSILYEVMMETINKELFEHINTSGLNILARPELVEEQTDKMEKLNVDQPMEQYTMAFKVGHYQFDLKLDNSMTLTRYKLNDMDKRAEEQLEDFAKQSARPEETSDIVTEGDIVYLKSIELNDDGSVKDGGFETTITLYTKGMNMSDSVKAMIIGKVKEGDIIDFNARELDLPTTPKSDEENEQFYRKYILGLEDDDKTEVGNLFKGTVTKVLRTPTVEMDENFFKTAFPDGNITTKADAIAFMKENLDASYDYALQFALRRQAKNVVIEQNQFELPETVLKAWFMENDKSLTEESVQQNMSALLNQVRWQLITDKLDSEIGFEVEKEDLEAYFEQKIRDQFKFDIPRQYMEPLIKRMMSNKEDMDNAKYIIRMNKIGDYVASQLSKKDVFVNQDDLNVKIEEDMAKEDVLFGVKN